jgi:hypothetical protein
MKGVLVLLLLLLAACISQPATSQGGGAAAANGNCPPTGNLIADSADAEPSAYEAGRDFVTAVSRRSYDPRAAWKMLHPWFVHRLGWSGVVEFAASDEGRPYPLSGIHVSEEAVLVSEVGGHGTLPHPKYRDFLLARAGVTRSACPEPVRDKIAASLWYLTLTPIGGNAPGYVLLVHTRSGYLVLSSDI